MKKTAIHNKQQRYFTIAVSALFLAIVGCKTGSRQRILHYNGATVRLPEEIDCAVKGDTLYVIGTRNVSKSHREITIGFSQPDSITLNKRFNTK